jgi:hypothetical protein
MECVPVARAVLVKLATPDESVPLPSVVAPSLKVTIPVGANPVTVAVNETEPLKLDGLALETSPIVLVTVFTVCASVAEVLEALFALPA